MLQSDALKILLILCIVVPIVSSCTHQTNKKIAPSPNKHAEETQQVILPGNAYFHYMESQLQKNSNNYNDYITHLEKATQQDNAAYLKKELANAYLKAKQYEKALNLLENVSSQKPDSFDTWLLIGGIYQAMDQMEKAIEAYEKALSIKSDKDNIYLLIAELYQKDNKWDKAKDIYYRLLELKPKSHVAYFFLGQIEKKEGNIDKAMQHYKQVVEISPDTLQAWFEIARLYKDQKKKKKVIKTYQTILKKDANNIQAMIELGAFYFTCGNQKKARSTFLGMVNILKKYPHFIKKIAAHFFDQEQNTIAIFALKALQDKLSESSGLHYYLGIHYEEENQDDAALKSYQHVLNPSEYYINAVLRMAYLHQKKGQFEDAIHLLEGLLIELPDDIELYLFLGSIYEEALQFDKAEQVFKEGLILDESNYKLLFRLGVVYDKWGKKEASMNQMKRVIELHPNNANALNYLGYTYADRGIHLDEAEILIRKALKHKPNDGYIIDSLGWVYFKRGMYDEAANYLKKALSLVPDDPIILEHVGDVFVKLNQLETAISYYQKALEFQKKTESRQTLKKKIQDIHTTRQTINGSNIQLNEINTHSN